MECSCIAIGWLIGNYSARILIDSGAEANFVAKRFVDQNELRRQKLRTTKSARLPEGTVLEVTEVVPNISFKTGSHKGQVSLLSVDMDTQADVILGMP